jgi:hypothetical protein
MHTRFKLGLILAIGMLVLLMGGVVHAQEETAAPCEGETVSGTVVDVDEETGTVTVETEEGTCTVTVESDYEHPIVALLGSYFGDVNLDDLTDALEATQGCAIQDAETGEWAWADCDTEGAVEVQVTGINDDGTFTATADGEEITVTVEDTDASDALSAALEDLATEFDLDEDGGLVQAGDEIEEYHDDGMGFGVLTKLYAMAAEAQEACAEEADAEEDASDEPCGVSVDELVTAFQSGTGMGQLFKEYGKPAILGVGHVKHALDEADDGDEATTNCVPRGKKGNNCKNGKGKGKGGD